MQDYEKYQERELDVQPIEYLKGVKYDYVLVAVWKQAVFKEIKKQLAEMGIANTFPIAAANTLVHHVHQISFLHIYKKISFFTAQERSVLIIGRR